MRSLVATVFLATSAQAEALHIGMNFDQPVFLRSVGDEELAGLDAVLIDRICSGSRYDCRFTAFTIADLFDAPSVHGVDVIIGGVFRTPFRDLKVDFTCPYTPTSRDFFRYFGNRRLNPYATTRIGVVEGSIFEHVLNEGGVDYTAFSTARDGLDAMQFELIDLFLGGLQNSQYGLNPEPRDRIGRVPDDVIVPVPAIAASIGVTEGNYELRADLNIMLAEMDASGELADLNARYLNIDDAFILRSCDQIDLQSFITGET